MGFWSLLILDYDILVTQQPRAACFTPYALRDALGRGILVVVQRPSPLLSRPLLGCRLSKRQNNTSHLDDQSCYI